MLLTRMIELADPDSAIKKKAEEAAQEATKHAAGDNTPRDDGVTVCDDDGKGTETENKEGGDGEDGDEDEDEEIGDEERESLKAAALYLYANDQQYMAD